MNVISFTIHNIQVLIKKWINKYKLSPNTVWKKEPQMIGSKEDWVEWMIVCLFGSDR